MIDDNLLNISSIKAMPKQDKDIKQLYATQLKKFGDNVAKYRKEKGMTQLDLAFASRLTLSYISKIESGKMNPSLVWIVSLARALDITVVKILKDIN